MTYYIYHIPGKKIGMTCDLYNRVTEQQGYEPHEYEVLTTSQDMGFASDMERQLQKEYGYKVDRVPYNKLKCNKNMKMKINVTEQTTTFPYPVNKLKGHLVDNLGMEWDTEFGEVFLTHESINWIMKNVKTSMYNDNRSYIYNKAFSRYFDNNDPHILDNAYQANKMATRTGGLFPVGADGRKNSIKCTQTDCGESLFDCIRCWAQERGLYDKGDPKTQTLKLMEEAGEICRAVLKKDEPQIIDGIGDCVVVLTNLAHLCNVSIEECIQAAYNEISARKGKMINGTFVKNN